MSRRQLLCASLHAEQIDRRLKGNILSQEKKGFRDKEKGFGKKRASWGLRHGKDNSSVVLIQRKSLEEKISRMG